MASQNKHICILLLFSIESCLKMNGNVHVTSENIPHLLNIKVNMKMAPNYFNLEYWLVVHKHEFVFIQVLF